MKPFLSRYAFVAAVLAGALLVGLSGCKIQKQGEGANKKVDIETPVGSLHVNTQADPKDTGMAVYPGATPAADEEGKHGANVGIDSSLFGVKIVAVKYHSDDPPEKLLDFYRKQLKSYGDVSECHGSVSFSGGHVVCHQTGSRNETNLVTGANETSLVTGTEERHHVVSVKPEGGGSKFALVYIQTRGEKGTL